MFSFRSKISAEAWVKEHPMALPPFFNWKAMGTVEDPLSGKTMKYSKGSASLNMFKVHCANILSF